MGPQVVVSTSRSMKQAHVAQLVEPPICNRQVGGSTPSVGSRSFNPRGRDQSGPNNVNWKGGHDYWQAGKNGRDPQGLSWKHQRQLAWVRDDYTCQDCGKKEEGWKPDCHHVVPYRISFSHALENLICLCRSCHKKAEAKIPELWGGQSFGMRCPSRPECEGCGQRRRKLIEGKCRPCEVILVLGPKAKQLRQQGFSYEEIGVQMNVSHPTARAWVLK